MTVLKKNLQNGLMAKQVANVQKVEEKDIIEKSIKSPKSKTNPGKPVTQVGDGSCFAEKSARQLGGKEGDDRSTDFSVKRATASDEFGSAEKSAKPLVAVVLPVFR